MIGVLGRPVRWSHEGRRRRAEPWRSAAVTRRPYLAAAAAAAWEFWRVAAAFGGVGQQKASLCTWNCFVTLYDTFLTGRPLLGMPKINPLWIHLLVWTTNRPFSLYIRSTGTCVLCMCVYYDYKSSSGDEIPERDVTYHLIYDYLFTTELRHICITPGYFWSNAYISNGRIGLRKAPCVSCYCPLSLFLA